MVHEEGHVVMFWGGYHYDTMSIKTLHQDAITIESVYGLVCWKYVSQGEPFHVRVSRVASCAGTKVSFINLRKRNSAQWPL